MALGTAEGVMNRAGINSLAFNWKNPDGEELFLKRQLEILLEECNLQWNLDPVLAVLYTSGTDGQKKLLAAAEEWKAAALCLLRPEIFKILGQHAPLDMEDSESFAAKTAELIARADELIDYLLGSVPSTTAIHGPVNHGFYDSDGDLLTLPITRKTNW